MYVCPCLFTDSANLFLELAFYIRAPYAITYHIACSIINRLYGTSCGIIDCSKVALLFFLFSTKLLDCRCITHAFNDAPDHRNWGSEIFSSLSCRSQRLSRINRLFKSHSRITYPAAPAPSCALPVPLDRAVLT